MVGRPVPTALPTVRPQRPVASIVIPVCDNLAFTRLCLETLLGIRWPRDVEIVVVDNGSVDLTPAYLDQLAQADRTCR